jgi:hypothetical protein
VIVYFGQFCAPFSPKSFVLNWTKYVLANILGDFHRKTSGHPGFHIFFFTFDLSLCWCLCSVTNAENVGNLDWLFPSFGGSATRYFFSRKKLKMFQKSTDI